MTFRILASVLIAVPLGTTASGCGATDRRAAVHGKVSVDGELVDDGSIVFVPIEDTKGQKVGAKILQGFYALDKERGPYLGKYLVQISWPKPTGQKVPGAEPGQLIDKKDESLPAKFNRESNLKIELTSADNVKDFELSTK